MSSTRVAIFQVGDQVWISGYVPPEVGRHPPTPAQPLDYSNLFKSSPTIPILVTSETANNGGNPSYGGSSSPMATSIPIKPIVYLHGEPTVRFEKKEVEVMIHHQDLTLAIVGKFSHGLPDIAFLRNAIPKQCGLKAEVRIGLLCDRHVLIRCTIGEDFDTLMSRQTFEIKEKTRPYLMRTFKWDVSFNPAEESRFAYGWISFPGLSPHYYGESTLFSLAAAVGSPIAIDAATLNKTRPSCARVKVEFDLLKSHPPHVVIQVGEGDGITTELQKIRYDFKPKYCTNCKLQGHDVDGCWNLKPHYGRKKLRTNDGGKVATAKATTVEIGKGKALIPTPSSSNPSQQNPIPTTNALIHAPSNNWTTVTRKNKKNKNQNPKPPTKVTGTVIPATGTVIPEPRAIGNTVQGSESERRFFGHHTITPSRLSMAIPATGRPPPEVGRHPPTPAQPLDYSNLFKSSPTIPILVTSETANNGGNPSYGGSPSPMATSIPIKPIVYLHGEPTVKFENKEVEVMIHHQDLTLAIVGKFSHGWPDIAFLRNAIPKQCGLKAEVRIGLLCDRHVLIRCTIGEDFDTLMSRQTFEIKEKTRPYLMRTFKWDVSFNPAEESRFAYGWISFPGLSPHYYGESTLFSLAAAVGSPNAIDAATLNKTRPSCARVKVEFDLLKSHPPHVVIQVGEGDGITTELQKIRYDFKPKYCTNRKLQGHDVDGCWNLKPKHYGRKKLRTMMVARWRRQRRREVEIGKGKASIPTPSSSNPSQQNPIPTTNALIHAPSNNWTTVTRKNKKNKNQNPKPPTKVTGTRFRRSNSDSEPRAIGNTRPGVESVFRPKTPPPKISDAGNPTGILGGAENSTGNPTGTLGGAGNPTGDPPCSRKPPTRTLLPAPPIGLKLMVESDDTIADVKAAIREREGIQFHRQIIIYDGQLFEDHESLVDCGIQHNSVVDERRFSAIHYPSPSRLSMAIPATGRPPPEVGHHPPIPAHPLNYSNVLKSSPTIPFLSSPETAINGGTSSPCGNASPMSSSIPIKPIVYLHGEPTVRFEKKEVEVMIHQQNLNLAVIGKFSHGWPEIRLLRTAIPKQCGLKAEVNIGLLCDRHVLIRCTIAEDYDTLMSRQTFEIKEKNKPYLMRTFKWDVTFNPEEETRFAYGWISFPGLPPHFHGESSLFSMAASVGIPISIDSATRNKTRPSSARVKEWTEDVEYLDESGSIIYSGKGIRSVEPGLDDHVMVGAFKKPILNASAVAKLVEIVKRWRWVLIWTPN
ncbi:hypothetical protein RND71_034634 [Anisodus tanguticus]|uniref:Ubiquitin-like domain-containing protein n=1 Tax=Anisodus tanguticus TaxID=243964 RepID=A0AAE1R3K3_9SOLA|nr:hypothetical protein RND71_034634 [Anisodus tanguticus]